VAISKDGATARTCLAFRGDKRRRLGTGVIHSTFSGVWTLMDLPRTAAAACSARGAGALRAARNGGATVALERHSLSTAVCSGWQTPLPQPATFTSFFLFAICPACCHRYGKQRRCWFMGIWPLRVWRGGGVACINAALEHTWFAGKTWPLQRNARRRQQAILRLIVSSLP